MFSSIFFFETVCIVASSGAFAALRKDGSAVTWGDKMSGNLFSHYILKCDTIIEVCEKKNEKMKKWMTFYKEKNILRKFLKELEEAEISILKVD